MSGEINTAGELRGFLADVLVGIREKRVSPDEATAIAKVAGEINRSLVAEVQTAIQSGVKQPVPGSMVIASAMESATTAPIIEPTEPAKNITENIPAAPVEQIAEIAKNSVPKPVRVAPPPVRTGDKVWCDQCEMQVTTAQAVGCKSPFCKAKDAA